MAWRTRNTHNDNGTGPYMSYARVQVGPICHVQRNNQRFPGAADDIKTFLAEAPSGNDDDLDESDEESDEEVDQEQQGSVTADAGVFDGEEIDPNGDIIMTNDSNPVPNLPPQNVGGFPNLEVAGDSSPTFPRVARMRCNLTTLSQRYNVYFTAYQDRIYVYQPNRGRHILPSPSLILQPRRTSMAKFVGGTISKGFPHQINHLVVGELGKLEILLMAYDDGDVVAFYTHSIANYITATAVSTESRSRRSYASKPRPPKEFFHQNVGSSAWGLAIHKESRLIAVSSNRHEVTVWAFATNHRQKDATNHRQKEKQHCAELDNSPRVWSGHTALQLEMHFQSRTRTWRIVLPLGPTGNNIPSITFADDSLGNAEMVIAVDIRGNTWFLDIWKIGTSPVLYPPTANRRADHHAYISWGILSLPDHAFKATRTYRETFGVPRGLMISPNTQYGTGDNWVDITCGHYYIPDAAANPDIILRGRHAVSYGEVHSKYEKEGDQDESEGSEDDYDEVIDASLPRAGEPFRSNWGSLAEGPGPAGAEINEELEALQGFRLARAIVPSFGQTTAPLESAHKMFSQMIWKSQSRKDSTRPLNFAHADILRYVAKNLAILRTTGTDVELQHLDPRICGIMCKDVLVQYQHRRPATTMNNPFDMDRHFSQRISMICHVPELNLVVLGSLTGRVALLTLTKTRKRRQDGVPMRKGFRVDWILPRKQEEEARQRPWAALHGIAVSPAPETGAQGLGLFRGPGPGGTPRTSHATMSKRYRLILHYNDHTILMYDLGRDARREDLLIF